MTTYHYSSSSVSMVTTGKILRKSIFSFFQNYQFFTTTAAVLAFPYAVSALLAQVLVPSSPLLPSVQRRLGSLFDAAGFPPSSRLFSILDLKLSQTIFAFLLVCPFTLSFLLLAKASVFQALGSEIKPAASPPSIGSVVSAYNRLFSTQICSFLLVLSANGACFSVLFVAFAFVDASGLSNPISVLILSAGGAVLYSAILAYAFVICNLAMAVSGTGRRGGYAAILESCVLIRGRTAAALSLALSVNTAMAGVEALFQYRIVKGLLLGKQATVSTALEGSLVAYLYAIILILDAIVGCLFLKSCETARLRDRAAGRNCFRIEEEDEDYNTLVKLKLLEDIP